MKPGVKLDVVIAKKLFGMKLNKNGASFVMDGHLVGHKFGKFRESLKVNDWRPSLDGWWWNSALPNYSTLIADAWPIADKLNLILVPQYVPGPGVRPRNGWAVYGDAESLHADIFEMPGDKRALACAKTAPHAICLAALKVVDNS